MTHFHWDHIQGIPFFAPLYNPANILTFHSSHDAETLREILDGQMTHPYFPVPFEEVPAKREFVCVPGEGVHYGNMSIHPFPMNHPQGATGYRLESGGATIVHASDLEHGDKQMDAILRDYAQNADVLIYDAQYTPEEYELKRGWGHSTWVEAVKVARETNVNHLVLFHHDPMHNDGFLEGVVKEARNKFENTDAAREGWSIRV
jgi:phosphoribosyl 1,2-cyclic phosphodiesterase